MGKIKGKYFPWPTLVSSQGKNLQRIGISSLFKEVSKENEISPWKIYYIQLNETCQVEKL